jgi:hypothetical protein
MTQTPVEAPLAKEFVRRARERGLSQADPDGLLKQPTKTVLETALNQEMSEHLGHEKRGRSAPETGNVRNGIRAKTVLTEGSGQVRNYLPRDRAPARSSRISCASGSGDSAGRTRPAEPGKGVNFQGGGFRRFRHRVSFHVTRPS